MGGLPFEQGRYYAFSRYLRDRFGCRVHKVTIDAGFTCPNRDGSRGRGGCIFCNNSGFSPNARAEPALVRRQLERGISRARRRSKAERLIAYFQAYSNTYARPGRLRELYDEAWGFPEVVGLSIGTRPDCVDHEKIDLIAGYRSRGEVWLEYGLQSAHDRTLAAINRGHSFREFLDAVEMTRDRGIKICVHTILGLPGESGEMMLETHRRLADLPIDGIKIHLLHVLRDTAAAERYRRGELPLLGRAGYVKLVCDVLELLKPTVVIQRMQADAPPDLLVAPRWCLDKRGVLTEINAELDRRDSWQGKGLGFARSEIPSALRSIRAGAHPQRVADTQAAATPGRAELSDSGPPDTSPACGPAADPAANTPVDCSHRSCTL